MSDLAALYRRVSTDKQDESLLAQERRVADYCTYKRLQPSDALTFADPDTSGRTPLAERDGGAALLQRLEWGGVSHVVVAKLDRLGRSARDVLNTLEIFDRLGVCLHIVDMGGDTVTTQGHMGRLILSIFASIAEWEVAEIRDRTKKVLVAKAQRGELTGHVPYGWDCIYTFADGFQHTSPRALNFNKDAAGIALLSAHGIVVSKQMTPNPAEQQVRDDVRQWRAWGHKLEPIANKLNTLGIRTKHGGTWSAGNVMKLLVKSSAEQHGRKTLTTDAHG